MDRSAFTLGDSPVVRVMSFVALVVCAPRAICQSSRPTESRPADSRPAVSRPASSTDAVPSSRPSLATTSRPSPDHAGGVGVARGIGELTTGRRRVAPPDFSRSLPANWTEWWETQRGYELALRRVARARRAAIDGGSVGVGEFFVADAPDAADRSAARPAATDFADSVEPVIRRVLDMTAPAPAFGSEPRSPGREGLRAACLAALGRIETGVDAGLVPLVLRELRRSDDELLRATAIRALAAAHDPAAGDVLVTLTRTGDADGPEVDRRDRAHALRALAMRAIRADLAAREAAFARLAPYCRDAEPGIARAAIGGIAQMFAAIEAVDEAVDEAVGAGTAAKPALERRSADRVVDALLTMLVERSVGEGDAGATADLAAALATILAERRADDPVRDYARLVLTRELDRVEATQVVTRVALITALGGLIARGDGAAATGLRELVRDAGDSAEAHAALIALGRIGGDDNRGFLANEVRRGSKLMRVPWASLGLGLAVGRSRVGERSAAELLDTDRDALRSLREALAATRRADSSGAIVLALGAALDDATIGVVDGALNAALRRGALEAWNLEALALLLARHVETSQFALRSRLERIGLEPLDQPAVLLAATSAIGELPLDAELASTVLALLDSSAVVNGPLELAVRLGRTIGARRYVALVAPLAARADDDAAPPNVRIAAFIALGELFADERDEVRVREAAWRRFAVATTSDDTPFGTF